MSESDFFYRSQYPTCVSYKKILPLGSVPFLPLWKADQMIRSILLLSPQEGVAGLSFTARIGRAQFYRARSASKKDGSATPSPLCLRIIENGVETPAHQGLW